MGARLIILYIGSYEDANKIRALVRQTPYKGSPTYHALNVANVCLTRQYDLIISNFAEGVETLLFLKQAFPGIPILYFGNDTALANQAVSLGAQDHIVKSGIKVDTLTRIVTFAREREEHTEQLRTKTFTDELTGLYNRRGFITLLEQQMELAKRTGQGFMLFLFDLDLFKQINDRFGHLVGDEALIQTAQCLCKSFRSHDIIARIGGDEFAVLALNSRPEGQSLFKRHLFLRLKELNANPNCPYSLSCSIGSAHYDGNGRTMKELLNQADKDLYKDKKKRHCLLLGREDKI
ncbi:MAG: diguanylate cyclase [Verrucomicrobia bacterium]|nr:diguanylate cyclase [Verrucomicrobiota bacterium]MBS0646888.1 diguanylate cyclase [Verrucomicrobiota bacterium]